MPAIILWPLLAGGGGLLGGFMLGSKASNLAIMAGSAAVIIYLLKGK
jgi:hypothetical protein